MADSEITRQDMIIRNMVSKSFNYVPYFHKKFWPEISTIIEISIDFDSHTIIEYQIFHVILPILQDNLAKILETHEYHLERIVKKMVVERGFLEIDEDDEYPDQPLAYFIVQMDKSTCQSYNHAENFFHYKGVPTKRTVLLLEEISETHGVFIMAVVQPTHCFDINGCDALLHSSQKRKMRSYPAPLCTAHIVRDWNRACEEVCHHRLIQRCFMRALRRDENGDIDEGLIPMAIREWYNGTDDEQDTLSQDES